ncbi:MAG: histidine kinase [Saprospiraceae bacterium]|nr:histidine kinase [Saprospiraceae bacterium]MCB9324874.1 histidine kinase [Lewinellaceae bacterium]
MMVSFLNKIEELEQKLSLQADPRQRLVLIDHLTAHYSFTDVNRALSLLEEQFKILETYDYPDFKLNFYLNKAIVENHRYYFEEAEKYYLLAMKMLKDIGTVRQQAETLIDYAGTCMNLHQAEKASGLLDKAKNLLKKFPDEPLSGRIICREGYINLHLGNYSKAIEDLLLAQKKIDKIGGILSLKDYYFLTLIYSGQGKIFEINDERKKSVKAYLKVVEMCESLQMRTRLSWHYLNTGNAYMSVNDTDNAITYFLKAIEIDDDVSEKAQASAYGNLGYIYFEEERYIEALELFEQAESLYQSDQEFYNLSIIAAWRGKLYAETGQRGKVLEQFELAYDYAKKITDFKQLSSVSKDIAAFYAEEGNYKEAYEFQLAHEQYLEKYNEQVDKGLQKELEAKYDAAEKRQETELLKLEATRLRLKALRAQMNPHFMYNALNSIQSFITSKDPNAAAKYLAKFAKLMRQSLDYSEVEVISLEKEIEFLETYLYINQKLRFEDRLTYKIVVEEEIEEDILSIPAMIVQPYIENAIEHGLRSIKDGKLIVTFGLLDDDTISCTIEDNGIGRKKVRELQLQDVRFQEHRSRGTSITEKRLQILMQAKGIDVHVNTIDLVNPKTGEATGTRVEIKIPIVEVDFK